MRKIFDLKRTDEHIQNYCNRNFQKLDFTNPNEKLLGQSYYYARSRKLKDYQARSFASELTALITKKLYDTGVGLIYNEPRLDSYLSKQYDKSEDLGEFVESMIQFYRSMESWKYERVGKYMQFKVSDVEKEMFRSLPAPKQIDRFNWLLKHYNYRLKELNYIRRGDANTTFSINIATSQYDNLMRVVGKTKTQKFLNLLYYGYSLNEN